MKRFLNSAAAVLVTVLVAVPVFAARGSANFSNFVALGDSYGAGFTGGSLNERHQVWSWPAVIARQVGLTLCAPGAAANAGCFAQPLVSYPGIGPELQLTSVVPSPVITPAGGQGQPLMLNFGRAYNNLSIPGATVGALLSLTGAEPQQPGEPTAVSMARFILRNRAGRTAVQQALEQNPTFIAMWIGGNDYLSVMFSGNPATMTSVADFRTRYEAVLNALVTGAPQAGMVVGNLPAVVPPYLALVPSYLVDPSNGQPVLIGGNRFYYLVDMGNGQVAPIAPSTLIPLQTRAKLAQGYGLPIEFKADPRFASLPNIGQPLSQDDILTQQEIAAVFTRVAEYNAVIQQLASARDIPVADINGLFQRVYAGLHLGPITVTAAPVTGGFFGLDFFHLTDLGYLLFANEYIRAINFNYDAGIPLASITQLFQNNGAFFGDGTPGFDNMVFTGNRGISASAMNQILTFWSQPTIKSSTGRFRGVRH